MHYLFPLIAISREGSTIILPDVDAFRAFSKGRVIGERFNAVERVWDWRTHSYVKRDITYEWIVRDDKGRVILRDSFGPEPQLHWRDLPHNRWRAFEYRNGPVPGVRRGWKRRSAAARKRHGGRGVAARNRLFHTGDPLRDLD